MERRHMVHNGGACLQTQIPTILSLKRFKKNKTEKTYTFSAASDRFDVDGSLGLLIFTHLAQDFIAWH